jgi:Putative restriction endonuclease
VSWDTYERLLAEHTDSPGTRFAYDNGSLEIMVAYAGHENPNRTLAALVEAAALALRMDFWRSGSTTFKRDDVKKGIEPDSSFYFDAHRHHVLVALRARTADAALLDQIHRELDFHRCFERITGEFAVTLDGMPVAHEQNRHFLVDRQVHRRSFPNSAVIHVAAPGAKPPAAKRLLLRRRQSYATPTHLSMGELHAEILEMLIRLG